MSYPKSEIVRDYSIPLSLSLLDRGGPDAEAEAALCKGNLAMLLAESGCVVVRPGRVRRNVVVATQEEQAAGEARPDSLPRFFL